jgi:predicted amidohydrolase
MDADLMVLPELAFTGYNFKDKKELESVAEDPSHSRTIHTLLELCNKKDFYVVTGFAEQHGQKVYNSAILLGPEGIVKIYRKIQLFFKEKDIFEAGDGLPEVQSIKGVKIGMMICFDWIFPEIMRILAINGADIICHPANLVLSYCQEAMMTRCLENNVFAVTANRFGADSRPHGILKFTGNSQIVAPKGKLLYRARMQREEVFVTEIDPFLSRDKRLTEMNDIFEDRRPEFYGDLCKS